MEINVFTYLKHFISTRKIYFLIYVCIIPVLPIVRNFVIPEITGNIYANIKNIKNIKLLLIQLACCFIIMPIATCIVNFMAWRLIPVFYEYIVIQIYEYIYTNTYCNYENLNIGEIIVKISRLKSILINVLSAIKEDFLNVSIAVLFGLFYFYKKTDIKYFFIYLAYIIIAITIEFFTVISISHINQKKQKIGDYVFSDLTDSFNNISIVQNFKNKPQEINIIKETLSKYNSIFFKSLYQSFAFDCTLKSVTCVWILLFGYMLFKDYSKHKISIVEFYQITQVVIMLAFICDFFGVAGRGLSEELGDIYDINDFFKNNIPRDLICNKGNRSFSNGDIIFKNIYHKYKKNNKYALENINLKIKKGDKVAFIGQSGSGKSTLVKLLLKKEQLIMGDITINNISVNTMKSQEIANHVFYIPQNPKLFNRTLYDNIIYGLKNPPSKESIIQILNEMNMKEISKVFVEKMNVSVGKDGAFLSGGQRQIVWLLRSLFRTKPIIILDEPTAALDPQSKQLLIKAIKNITVGKTVIIITHDNIISDYKQIHFKAGKQIKDNIFDIY
jgi:ABC-type bacteriocin/lantibiotic exporter with double-glycine peptidase domain